MRGGREEGGEVGVRLTRLVAIKVSLAPSPPSGING